MAAFLPFIGVCLFIVAWFWFATETGVRCGDMMQILAGYEGTRQAFRSVLVVGFVAALCVGLMYLLSAADASLAVWLGVIVGLLVLFSVCWIALGTRRLGLQSHLILNVWLYRSWMKGLRVSDSVLAGKARLRVGEREWFHRMLFRIRRLSLQDVVESVLGSPISDNPKGYRQGK